MVQTLEAIKGGGGSMKVGTTGTISVLMSRELESVKSAAKTPASSCTKKPPSICSFVAGAATSPKRTRPKSSPNEASSSRTRNGKGHKSPEVGRKAKNHTRKAHEIPILEPETSSVDETPVTTKPVRRGLRIVEIVDIKCGSTDKPQASPLKNPLKKLSFSKLSGSPV
ncbi:uncharacterized protein LOC116023162 [Ipomoea triloba]|uniref:uncharacterized protein LOC116023162 n=1 Tax=Ipomoea triloba TaxID=35885 RepID=UPI00125E278B|nr:uncharacterized protein LOC116023162 [Ipomoea triloba]